MNTKVVLLFAALFLMIATQAFAITPEAQQVEKLLSTRTNGNDPFYNKVLAPAQSLEQDKNKSARTQSVNNGIVREVDLVLNAFKSAAADKKIEAVNAVVAPELISSGGAFISFVDGNPSAANSRTLLFISKKNNPLVTVNNVLNVLTSYKRSAKPSDYVYEYSDVQNLTSGQIKATVGSENSWKLPEAPGAMLLNQNYGVKKCRQIFGWRCATSLYRADSFLKGADAVSTTFISMIDLTSNSDHGYFAGDKRSVNQISGSTALYVIKESTDWVLIYGTDVQLNNGKLQFASTIQSEFKKDFLRFRERLSLDLKVSAESLR